MGNVPQVFRDITEDGNVWDQDKIVLPSHADVLSEQQVLPSLFLAPDASSMKASVSRSSLTGSVRSGSSRCLSFSDDSNDGFSDVPFGTFLDDLPSQVVLQTTCLCARKSWAEDLSPCRRSKPRWLPLGPETRLLLSEGSGSELPEVYDVPSDGTSRIKIVKALSDNYMYLVVATDSARAVAIDPAEGEKTAALCKSLEIDLVAVLNTHYHADHSGGNAFLASALPGLEVVVGERDADRTPAVTRRVQDGESIELAGLSFRCVATPCHTRGHVCFFLDADDGQAPALFSGDALFVAGCGRFMEGTALSMRRTLHALAALPKNSRLFCGHEYTVGNLEYALSLEPSSNLLKDRLDAAKAKRAEGLPTVPSTLLEEQEHNPFFLALNSEGVDDLTELSRLRRGKDTFTFPGKIITMVLDVQSYFYPPVDEARLRLLRPQLPITCRMARAWRLLYDPRVHGVSIGTFFRQCQAWPGETLILVEDAEGSVFGALASQTWHVSNRRHFGQPSCFAFRFDRTEAGEEIDLYPWAGVNQYFLFADSGGLKVGGGRSAAIWIDADFLKGASGACDTFGTAAPLSSSEEFVVRRFECWGFDTAAELDSNEANLPSQDSRLLLREQAWEQASPQLSVQNGPGLGQRAFECRRMAEPDDPLVINVVGRHKERENQDLQGEYHMIGMVHGRPAYRKPGTRTVIRYWPVADRWLIDREGVQESDICNAYAEQGGARHPAVEELVWRVWESQHRQHVRDPEFLVTAAPNTIQVLGRAAGKENWALNGERSGSQYLAARAEQLTEHVLAKLPMHLGLSDGSALSSIEVSSPSYSGVSTYSAPSFGDVWERCETSPPPALAPPNIGRAERGTLDAPVGPRLHAGVRLPPPRPVRPVLSETALAARSAMTGANLSPAPCPEAADSADQELFLAHSAVSTETHSFLGLRRPMAQSTVPSVPLSPPCLARRCPPVYLWAPFPDSEPDTGSLPRPESLESASLLAEAAEAAELCRGLDNFQAGSASTENSEMAPSPETLKERPSDAEAVVEVVDLPAKSGMTVSLAPARRLRGIRLREPETFQVHAPPREGPRTEPQAAQAEPERTWPSTACESAAGPLDAWCTYFEDAVPVVSRRSTVTGSKTKSWRAAQVAALAESQNLRPPGQCVEDLDWTPRSELPTQHADHEHGESVLPTCDGVHAARDASSDSDSDYWTSSAHHRFESEFGDSVQEDQDSEQHGRRAHHHGPGSVSSGKASASPRLKRVLDLRGLLSPGSRRRSGRPRVTLSLDASGGPSWLGEYKLIGLHQGKVAYQKAGKFKHAIRYWRVGDRWLIDLEGLRDVDICNAYADAQSTSYPGEIRLQWHIWDSTRQRHTLDSSLCTLVTPSVIEVVGRESPKENTAMNGSYHLVGLHAGQPAYMKTDGSGHAIRYWPREERWLIDLDGLRDTEICNAYAEAGGTGAHMHPGHLNLVWHVWETSRGRHLTDPAVRSFVAPHFVRISGRDPYKENSTINGDYELVKIVEGKPAYKKADADHVIRFWPAEERWIIDLEAGFHGGDVANSFADAKGAENPGNSELLWYVWETSRGRHVPDEDVIADAVWLPPVDWSKVPGVSD
ncbi:Hagh [Symbiodinium microadriaticum]|nr:Hagh [Symbiodinium microadriaticum]CAE7869482.1 Hagh [Symbiodinium sp. KB8]